VSDSHSDLVRRRAETLVRLHQQHQFPYTVLFGGLELQVIPDVFCPAYGEGSHLLGMCLQGMQTGRVLDVGTGSGALAILAAARGMKVVATDISSAAVQCASLNSLRLGLGDRLEVRQGDLFEPVNKGEKFSLILFNPPFLCGQPAGLLEHAIYDEKHETLKRFLQGLSNHLERSGKALIAFSTAGDMDFFWKSVQDAGLRAIKMNEFRSSAFDFFAFEVSVRS